MPAGKFRRMLDTVSGSPTFIGNGTTFSGDFSGAGHFVICGSVEGNCQIDGPLSLAAGGQWKGDIHARNVVVAGEVDGHVFADGKLELASTARVSGSINGASIAIAEGAVIQGEMHVRGSETVKRFKEKRKDEPEDS